MTVFNPASPAIYTPPTNNVSYPANALATDYRNNTAAPRMVIVSVQVPAAAQLTVYMDTTSTPTTLHIACGSVAGLATIFNVCFVVPSMWYYKLTCPAGTVSKWAEYS